jgi:hypothetical protein
MFQLLKVKEFCTLPTQFIYEFRTILTKTVITYLNSNKTHFVLVMKKQCAFCEAQAQF